MIHAAAQKWVDAGEFDLDAADEILAAEGFRRVGDWDQTLNEYAQARIEPL